MSGSVRSTRRLFPNREDVLDSSPSRAGAPACKGDERPSEIVYVYEGPEYAGEGSGWDGMAVSEAIRAIERGERGDESTGAAQPREHRGVLRSAA